ncbi:MAG: arsenate reductase ArsC [Calditrichia bacterium]|nr:arsenate reductase ArsC [Calditrichia bacterium]
MKRILILCNGNSARSQMAQEFLKRITFNRVEVLSAGIKTKPIHPMAVKVMLELGIDISGNESKSVNKFYHDRFDYVITVCDEAREKCPDFQGSFTKIHKSIEDPAIIKGTEQEKMEVFRTVRDNIKEWLTDFADGYKLG